MSGLSERKVFPSMASVLHLVRDEAILVGSAVTACNLKECKDLDIVVSWAGLKKLVKAHRHAMNGSARGAYTLYAYEKIIDVFFSTELDCLCERKNRGKTTFREAMSQPLVEVRPYGVRMRGLRPALPAGDA